jgi:predicted DNA binding CopG/RHH family protein
MRVKNAPVRGDAQLREFERKDLGDDIAASGSAVVVRPQRPTSILLGDDLIAKLKRKGARRGLPYQTMLKLIVREHIDEY